MKFEELWYETSPFIYALLGLAVLLNGDGLLAKISGSVLLVAAASVVRMRWKARLGSQQLTEGTRPPGKVAPVRRDSSKSATGQADQ